MQAGMSESASPLRGLRSRFRYLGLKPQATLPSPSGAKKIGTCANGFYNENRDRVGRTKAAPAVAIQHGIRRFCPPVVTRSPVMGNGGQNRMATVQQPKIRAAFVRPTTATHNRDARLHRSKNCGVFLKAIYGKEHTRIAKDFFSSSRRVRGCILCVFGL